MMEKYLKRVGLSSAPSNSERGLRDLHAAQVFSVPFENLTVFIGEKPDLALAALEKKLLDSRRGGYCFEINGLFSHALKSFGFEHQVHLARVQSFNPEPGPLTHQVMIAQVAGREWLCDVGFGGPGIRYPMPFELNRVESQDGEDLRLRLDADFGVALEQKKLDGTWEAQYFFHRTKIMPMDIEMGNLFTATWEKSIFKKTLLIAKPFPGGKHTIFGREFKTREGASTSSLTLETASHLLTILREKIGVELSESQERMLTQEFSRLKI